MIRVPVRPQLLRWARERSQKPFELLVERFPKLEAWERGEAHPTFKQLEAFAQATFTPIGFLFAKKPPDERLPIQDFRTVGSHRMGRPSPHLLDTIYTCQLRQDWYRDFLRAQGEERLAFIGSATVASEIVATAATIRQSLDLEARRRMPTWSDALRAFVEQAEDLGVLVMCSGVVLNNNTRVLDPEEFRGFALADDLAPLVFINGADTKAAQMFTLAHELAHLWLGESALSDAVVSQVGTHRVERWCNQVAAEMLAPLQAVRDEYRRHEPVRDECERLARAFKVSTLVMLRRMHDAGGLTAEELRAAYAAEIARLRPKATASGGDFYATIMTRVSRRFARALILRTLEGVQSFTETFQLLGIKKTATLRELGHRMGVGY